MDGEALFRQERLDNPRRLFFDVKGARASDSLQDATLKFTDGVVRVIRSGRRPNNTRASSWTWTASRATACSRSTTRIESSSTSKVALPAPPAVSVATNGVHVRRPPVPIVREKLEPRTGGASRTSSPPQLRSRPSRLSPPCHRRTSTAIFAGAAARARHLTHRASTPGTAATIPGARANGVNEAELVLDVAGRLRDAAREAADHRSDDDAWDRCLRAARAADGDRQPARRADLFLSIHANASRNSKARGVETYFLNFASNPEAEAVAARENSTSGGRMHSLPEIVRAIALNNKIDESRDFADMVQKSMVEQARRPERSGQRPGRQAGAVRRPHRRRNAERAGRDFLPDEQAGRAIAQDRRIPATDCRGAVRGDPEISGRAEEDADRGGAGIRRKEEGRRMKKNEEICSSPPFFLLPFFSAGRRVASSCPERPSSSNAPQSRVTLLPSCHNHAEIRPSALFYQTRSEWPSAVERIKTVHPPYHQTLRLMLPGDLRDHRRLHR